MRRFYDLLKQADRLHVIVRKFPAATQAFRWMSYFAYRSLELLLGSRHPHIRFAEQLRELRSQDHAPDPDPDALRVLFYTKRGWYAHVATEMILAEALKRRNVDSMFLVCGGGLEQCDFKPATDDRVTPGLCRRCVGFADRVIGDSPFPVRRLGGDLLAEETPDLGLDGLSLAQLEQFEYSGYPIGEWVLPSVQRSLLRGDVGRDPRSMEVYRGYIRSAARLVDANRRLLDEERPDRVVVTNGSFFAERIMLELAGKLGIPVVSYERAPRKDALIIASRKPVIPLDLERDWQEMRGRPLTEAENYEIDEVMATRLGGDVGTQQLWKSMAGNSDVRAEVGVPSAMPLVAAFTNVLWDTAVFRRDTAFDGMFDWIGEVLNSARSLPDVHFLVRVHPAEVRIPMAESRDRVVDRLAASHDQLPANVTVIGPDDPMSSYSIAQEAALVLTYTSTIGLEAASMGKRVLVGGATHYAQKGFTWEVGSRGALTDLIVEGMAAPMAPEEVEMSRRYAHLYFIKYQRRFPWFSNLPRSERGVRIESLDELSVGEDADLDHICDLVTEP